MLVAVDIEKAIVLWSLPHPNPMKMSLQQLRSSFPKNFLQLELQGGTVLTIQTWRSSWEISHRKPLRIWDFGENLLQELLNHTCFIILKTSEKRSTNMHLLCVLAHQEWKAARGSIIFHPSLGSFACMKDGEKGRLESTSNLWQEVNPSLFRRLWPKTNIWTSWNRNHGIQTNGRIAWLHSNQNSFEQKQ